MSGKKGLMLLTIKYEKRCKTSRYFLATFTAIFVAFMRQFEQFNEHSVWKKKDNSRMT